MRSLVFLSVLLSWLPVLAEGLKGGWELERSELTYTATHPFHVVHGKSLSARGKGVCYDGFKGKFLVAVPVKSFVSGDANRDVHMLEVTRGGLYPLIEVRVEVTGEKGNKTPGLLSSDIEVRFAGKTVKYPRVELKVSEWKPNGARITGVVPLTLKDFDIQPPSLLAVPIQNDVPVQMDLIWKRVSGRPSTR